MRPAVNADLMTERRDADKQRNRQCIRDEKLPLTHLIDESKIRSSLVEY